jgi:hypothetical protein
VPDQIPVTSDDASLLLRLIGGHAAAADEILALAPVSDNPGLLVAAAMLSRDATHLVRAQEAARTPRDRQLVVLAQTHLRGDTELFDVLVRDHLADHPDHLMAAWIAGRHHST